MAISFDSINVVLEKELLPSLIQDITNPRLHEFTDWRFSGFNSNHFSGLMEGTLTAVNVHDGLIYHRKVVVSPDSIVSRSIEQIVNYLDQVLHSAVYELILNTPLPHAAGVLCRNNFCEECYR